MILSLAHSNDLRVILGSEKCGLAAAINIDEAGRMALTASVLMVHRGEVAFGGVSVDGRNRFNIMKKRGSVREKFQEVNIDRELPGKVAITHNRYATAGDPGSRKNIQPLVFSDTRFGPLAIAHNGTLVNQTVIRQGLIERGAAFQSTTDTETIIHLMLQSGEIECAG